MSEGWIGWSSSQSPFPLPLLKGLCGIEPLEKGQARRRVSQLPGSTSTTRSLQEHATFSGPTDVRDLINKAPELPSPPNLLLLGSPLEWENLRSAGCRRPTREPPPPFPLRWLFELSPTPTALFSEEKETSEIGQTALHIRTWSSLGLQFDVVSFLFIGVALLSPLLCVFRDVYFFDEAQVQSGVI